MLIWVCQCACADYLILQMHNVRHSIYSKYNQHYCRCAVHMTYACCCVSVYCLCYFIIVADYLCWCVCRLSFAKSCQRKCWWICFRSTDPTDFLSEWLTHYFPCSLFANFFSIYYIVVLHAFYTLVYNQYLVLCSCRSRLVFAKA